MIDLRRELSRQRTRNVAGMAVTAALVIAIIGESWAGNPVSGTTIAQFLIAGIALGSIYGVAAQGLVVTYTTSGVFNFAQGAIGMFMAFVYWQLKVGLGLPTLVAALLTVLVLAPLAGLLIERVLMRRLADAPLVSQLVVTIGLMLAAMGLAASIWNPSTARTIPTFFGDDGFSVGGTFIPYYRLITICAGIAIGVGLRFLLYHTRLGLTMRAVVDSRDLTLLSGARPARASMTAWALGSSMAALAGIFLAEEVAALDTTTLTLFIVDAFAAGIIARLRSLPMAYAGGLIIGLALSFQQSFLNWSGRWTSAPSAIPAVILFIALLFVPEGRIAGRASKFLGGEKVPSPRRALFGFGVLLIAVLICVSMFSRTNDRNVLLAILTAFVMLSMVPLTGWANQVSLAQITLMGVGAFAFVEWGQNGSVLGLVFAAASAVPVGIVMAFPAIRLRGLYLALATMAFARMAEYLFFDQPEVFGSSDRTAPGLDVFGLHVNNGFPFLNLYIPQDAGFLITSAVLFCLIGTLVFWTRKRAFGRRLIAMRDSSAACATVGLNVPLTKLAVFAYSAAIAGLAGALFAVYYGSVSVDEFQVTVGLPYLLLLAVGGTAVISGTVFGGLGLTAFTWLASSFSGLVLFQWLQNIGPGLAGIGVGQNPNGTVVQWSRHLSALTSRKAGHVDERQGPLGVREIGVEFELPPLPPRVSPRSPVLELSGVSVRFGGLQALREVTIDVAEGAITGLIGPNGAGKTTLFNVATGLQEPRTGRIVLDGADVTGIRPHRLARRGLARTFQRLETFGSLTVRENILVAAESHHRTGRHGTGHHRAGRRQDRRSGVAPADLTDAILDWTGLRPVAGTRADQLPTGTARLVELARTLATRPRVLLLDEPSSGLSAAETGQLAALLRRVIATGVAILLVEHDMSFIMDLCSRVFVLDAGEIIAQGSPAQVQANPEVLKAYLGDTAEPAPVTGPEPVTAAIPASSIAPAAPAASVTEPAPSRAAAGTEGEPAPALDLSNVSAGYGGITAVFDVDLTLRHGEVCALLGPNGAGKSTILKVASGQLRPSAGTVSVAGRPIDGLTADRIVRGGLGVVPEGRGVFPNLTVAENLTMATYAGARRESIAEAGYERFPVLSQRRRQLAGTLSGGEQQMLAIARVLAANPSVLLLDELSMGLAPRIVGELYEVIGSIAAGGLSILVVEQFAHEVLRVADTAVVLINGRIAHQGTPSAIDGVLRSAYLAGAREEA